MKTLKFGIEIETVGQGRQTIAQAIQTVVGGAANPVGRDWQVVDARGRIWKVVPDASLSGGDYASGEIVSPILGYEDIEQLQQVVRAVREAGCRADPSTGIHIHVDGARFDARGVTNLVKMVNKQERLIEAALGVSDERRGRYCKPVDPQFLSRLEAHKPQTLQDVNRAWYGFANAAPQRYDNSRYHSVNLNSLFFRGTVEFRWFQGTLHAGEVRAYVQFVLALCAKAIGAKNTRSQKRDLNPTSSRYDFRVFLLQLGLIGDEFKTARLHLLKRLGGSAAWKRGRPPQRGADLMEAA